MKRPADPNKLPAVFVAAERARAAAMRASLRSRAVLRIALAFDGEQAGHKETD